MKPDAPRSRTLVVMIVFALAALAAMATTIARTRAGQTPSAAPSVPGR